MTLVELAAKKRANDLVKKVAAIEKVPVKGLLADIAKGYAVIPANSGRTLSRPCGIGRGLLTKINVNLGTSPYRPKVKEELAKLKMAVELGADAVMDLSVGGNIRKIRRAVIEKCPIPLGTVPVYEAAVGSGNDVAKIPEKAFFDVLKAQAEDGVDFFTIHAGVTRKISEIIAKKKRLIDIVSRGGAMMNKWMRVNRAENPFYRRFDEVIDLAREYDITLSLGDGLRPGAIADAGDAAQIGELKVLGELQQRALKKGVQVLIEGPGHVPINKIEEQVRMEKKYCHGAPFYVLGPLVTDIAPGYDHITAAIGGALAGSYGADFLCYVTPAEHLRIPSIEDVKDGIVASKIAAHAADIAKGRKDAWDRDAALSAARRKRDWETQFDLSIEQKKPRAYRRSSLPDVEDVCTMCGGYCPIRLTET